ncbi:hypothetical protein GCM10009578_067880 [Streptomyces rhizosphaericus]
MSAVQRAVASSSPERSWRSQSSTRSRIRALGWAKVAVRTRAVTRSGWRVAARRATGPPREYPAMAKVSRPSSTAVPTSWSARVSRSSGPLARGVRPEPG